MSDSAPPSIYAHYLSDSYPEDLYSSKAAGFDPSVCLGISLPINEAELYQAMQEAERSYEEWKKMESALRTAFQQLKLSETE